MICPVHWVVIRVSVYAQPSVVRIARDGGSQMFQQTQIWDVFETLRFNKMMVGDVSMSNWRLLAGSKNCRFDHDFLSWSRCGSVWSCGWLRGQVGIAGAGHKKNSSTRPASPSHSNPREIEVPVVSRSRPAGAASRKLKWSYLCLISGRYPSKSIILGSSILR